MRKLIGLSVVLTLGVGGGLVLSAPASATPAPECVTAVWEMPSWAGERTPTWSQTLVDSYPTECYNLNVTIPTDCDTQYQIDSYLNNETTAALLEGGFLDGPNNPRESFPPNAGWDKTYKLVQNPACPPEPETKVEYGEWVAGEYECDDTTVTETRTVTTTTFSLVDNVWVGTPATTEESQTRDLTEEEIAELDCQLPTTLAETGSADSSGILVGGLALLGTGLMLTAIRFARILARV